MKKTSIVFTIAFTLIGIAPLSASYWSEIQEYLPQWSDFKPTCWNRAKQPVPVVETATKETVVEKVVVNEASPQEKAVEPSLEEPATEVAVEGLDAAKGMQNLIVALKKKPFIVSGAHAVAAERGAFNLIKSLAIYAKSKDVLATFKPVQVAGIKFFKKPNLGAKHYFSCLENFSKAPLKLDENFVLNELKAIAQQMRSKKANLHVVFGHLCALHALIQGQDEKLASSIKPVIAKFSKCQHKPKQVVALAQALRHMVKEAEKRG